MVGKSFDVGGQTGIVVGVLAPDFEVLFPPNTHMDATPEMFNTARIDFELTRASS